MTQPDILLLDEPTNGFDTEFKVTFALVLRRLVAHVVTVMMVSHDVPFSAEYAHKCGLFFDGSIVAEGTPREFFSGNSFYTTPANRMARHLIPKAVTVADIIGCCGGETGFLVGAVTMMVSNVLFFQGPWMPWQMFSMGIISFLVSIVFVFKRQKPLISVTAGMGGFVLGD